MCCNAVRRPVAPSPSVSSNCGSSGESRVRATYSHFLINDNLFAGGSPEEEGNSLVQHKMFFSI